MNIEKTKQDIKREDLKYSFIKQIVLTFEFSGLNKGEVKAAEENVRNNLYELGYKVYKNLQYEEYEEEDDELKLGVGKKAICSYSIPGTRAEVLFSEDFVTLVDSIERYKKIETYFEVFTLIIDALKNVSGFFIPQRLGIRKKNVCYIKDLEKICNYFNPKVFPEYEYKTLFGIDKVLFEQKRDFWIKDNINIDFERMLVGGDIEIDGKDVSVYQLILDFDVYVQNDDNIMKYISSKNECNKFLDDMNKILYKLYTQSLNYEFLKAMTEEKFKDKGNVIIGVTKNV